MRFKLIPAAPDAPDRVRTAQRAVPLVPDSEDDCCARLMRRCGFRSRDVARTWLTFLRALELVEETPSGFKRLDREPTVEHLRDALVRRSYLASPLLEALGETPLTDEAAFAVVRDRVPPWEHQKEPTRWADIWAERATNTLDWLSLLGLAKRTPAGYVAVE